MSPMLSIQSVVGFSALVLSTTACFAETPKRMWVATERLNIRSCPDEACGLTGWETSGASVDVYETRDGWARISEPQTALCENGFSVMIDEGDNRCVEENGILDGMMTRWVSAEFLSATEPREVEDPADCDSGFLSSSDNYDTYGQQFCVAARQLIDSGDCTEAEFIKNGGWWASSEYPQGTFYTYCGGMTLDNKIYLDAKSGNVFR